MDDSDDSDGSTPSDSSDGNGSSDDRSVDELQEELRELRAELESKTIHRETIADELREDIRRRIRRSHARGWGPYLVLLYGTIMTVAAFYYETGITAILAMIIIWLSTLGLYVFMLVVGAGLTLVGLPGRAINRIRDR